MGCFLGAFAAPAFADGYGAPASDAPGGQNAVTHGLQGSAGMISARILLDHNFSADQTGKPVSLAPDLFYSVTDRLQFGILHQGPMGWQARPGLGVCLTGKDTGCGKIYDNIGYDVMYDLALDRLHLSAHGSLFMDHIDPTMTSLALGAAGKVYLGNDVALIFDPKISISLNHRDTNDDALFVPLELEFQARAPTTLKLLTGVSGSLANFGDTYQIPVGAGLVRNLNEHFDLGARFCFDNFLGQQPQGASRADTRSLAILLNIRS